MNKSVTGIGPHIYTVTHIQVHTNTNTQRENKVTSLIFISHKHIFPIKSLSTQRTNRGTERVFISRSRYICACTSGRACPWTCALRQTHTDRVFRGLDRWHVPSRNRTSHKENVTKHLFAFPKWPCTRLVMRCDDSARPADQTTSRTFCEDERRWLPSDVDTQSRWFVRDWGIYFCMCLVHAWRSSRPLHLSLDTYRQ